MDTQAFFDELIKIGQVPVGAAGVAVRKAIEGAKTLGPGAAKHWKIPALVGGGGASTLVAHQAYKDWELGRRFRKQSE